MQIFSTTYNCFEISQAIECKGSLILTTTLKEISHDYIAKRFQRYIRSR